MGRRGPACRVRGEPSSCALRIRVTPREYQQIQRLAHEYRLPVADVLRLGVLSLADVDDDEAPRFAVVLSSGQMAVLARGKPVGRISTLGAS